MISSKLVFFIKVITSFLFVLNYSYAQISLGLNGGIAENRLLINTQNDPNLNYNKCEGYYLLLEMKYQFNRIFFVATQPTYIKKNYNVENAFGSSGNLSRDVINSYIQFPMATGFIYRYNRFKLSIEGGVFLGYWINSLVKGTVGSINFYTSPNNSITMENGSLQFNSKRDNRIEYGWLLGGALEYQIIKNWSLNIHTNFYQSLSDQQKNYMIEHIERFNRTQICGIEIIYLISSLQGKKPK